MSYEHPQLRSNLRTDNYVLEGDQKYVIVTDVLIQGREVKNKLKMPYDLWQIALLMDGQSDKELIRKRASEWYWKELSPGDIEKAIDQLDKYYLLKNDRYENRLAEIQIDLSKIEARNTVALKNAFEPDGDKLLEQIEGLFLSPFGPGRLPSENQTKSPGLKGVISPHANYAISGPCAAHAYQEIAGAGEYDLFIIIGYNHIYAENKIETLMKDIITPIGKVAVDTEFGRALLNRASDLIDEGGIANYHEHSIDMQMPLLKYILRQTEREARIFPLILSNIPKLFNVDAAFNFRRKARRTAEAIRDTIAELNRKTCLIASGDFTHHGPYYGDGDVDDGTLEYIKKFDAGSLDLIVSGRKDDFYKRALPTKYCCTTPIYLLMSILDPEARGRVLKYYNSWDINGESQDINTFASVAFY